MAPAFRVYLAAWALACAGAVVVALVERRRLSLFMPGYAALLGVRWKLVTFAVAASGMVVVAPYTGDPTWDAWDAGFMAVLTYLTAPWSVGTLFLALRRGARPAHAYLAASLWLFSASWSYDLYILARDGFYPLAWQSNLVLSSILYLCAGLMWNLEWRPGHGATFSFLRPGWPAAPGHAGFARLLWIAAPFMLLAATLILAFVYLFFRS
jgi:hypothetical protein